MTNNFDIFETYLINRNFPLNKMDINDSFIDIQLIRRGKDYPGLQGANYTFKTYYIDSLDSFIRYKDEIIKCCDMFGLRAYISVNIKSKKEASLKTLKKYADYISINEFKKPWKSFSSVCGGLDGKEKVWIIDIDDVSIGYDWRHDVILYTLKMCDCRYDNPYIMTIPTKSGYHILTHPFNLQQFNKIIMKDHPLMEIPDIKKNHITLIYENIG